MIKGQLNLSREITNILFVSKSSLLSQNSKIFVTLESHCHDTWFSLWKRVFLAHWWLGQWRRKWVVLSISWPKVRIGDTQSWKLCLNLSSPKWLSPSSNLVSNSNPLVWWILKVKFASDLINFNSSFLNTLTEEEFRIFISRLFHSVILLQEKRNL